jgi:hypothetical protein
LLQLRQGVQSLIVLAEELFEIFIFFNDIAFQVDQQAA